MKTFEDSAVLGKFHGTSQQEADALLAEHRANRGKRVNESAKHHLTYLEAGAEMVSRHARALPFRLPYKTAAQDELQDAVNELETALRKVREAMVEYDCKPLETAS